MEIYRNLDSPATEDDVEVMFQVVLGRPVNDKNYRRSLVSTGITLRQVILMLRNSTELKSQIRDELDDRKDFDAPASENDVELMFEAILRRSVNDDGYRRGLVATGITLRQLIYMLRGSLEFRNLSQIEHERQNMENRQARQEPAFYRCPQDLVVTPLDIKRIVIVGSCLSTQLTRMRPNCVSEFYSFGQNLPQSPARPITDYDFQIVQLPLRYVLPDATFVRLKQTDGEGHENLFAHALNATQENFRQAMRWSRDYGILTFVFPFLVPQQNLVGRLMPRYDLRNPVHFVEKLNMVLASELQAYPNAYFFDVNEIMATYGKRYVQEDMVWAFNHGSYLTDFDALHDGNRAEPAPNATELYELNIPTIMFAVWEELQSVYRTTRQVDMVKMIVIDLDDTLWRGTVAELDVENMPTSEGWPIAFWEALEVVKRRGILLAVISKNEESLVVDVWDRILGRNLPLEDIGIRRINWLPKSDDMADILLHVNLLPRNVVYIDDNPTQRAEIKAAFPEIRVLGGSPLTWRHILLWSAETQVPNITSESSSKTEMVRAQVVREGQRCVLSREQFLASLAVQVKPFVVDTVSHARFSRVLELVNKANQFNTTGQRWTQEECVGSFAKGMKFYAFEVADHYTEYGTVGVLVVDEVGIRQFVMSCRVMGLEAEVAAIAQMIDIFRAKGHESIFGAMIETDRNLPCRDVYSRSSFEPTTGGWTRATAPGLPVPAHITLVASDDIAIAAVRQDQTPNLDRTATEPNCGNHNC